MIKPVYIGKREIGAGQPCFIIAEAGVNHNGNMDMAFQLVNMAVAAKADCIKFQTFTTELCESKSALKPDYFFGRDSEKTKLELSKELELNESQFNELKQYCDSKGIIFLSMAADYKALNTLLNIGMEAIKISSSDTLNIPLLERIGETKLPVILSTGMSTIEDIELSFSTLKNNGSTEISILQCTSQYPAPYDEINLHVMKTYQERFKIPIGLSDHSKGIHIPVAAVAMGAHIVEKHFTLSHNLPGVDHAASIEPNELKELIQNIKDVETAFGTNYKSVQPSEREHLLTMRKSLVIAHDTKDGTLLKKEDILVKRPGGGILPSNIDKVIGKRLKKTLFEDDIITWDVLE